MGRLWPRGCREEMKNINCKGLINKRSTPLGSIGMDIPCNIVVSMKKKNREEVVSPETVSADTSITAEVTPVSDDTSINEVN